MELQQKISLEFNKSLEGGKTEVLIDEISELPSQYIGRSYREAPGIDGSIFINCDSPAGLSRKRKKLKVGDMVSAVITRGLEYDLEAKLAPGAKGTSVNSLFDTGVPFAPGAV